MINQHHPFHIVYPSPWPLLVRLSTISLLVSTTYFIHRKNRSLILWRTLSLCFSCTQWWRDVSRERTFQGFHTNLVINGLRWGIILFITSEVLFFFSFFWSFFHNRLRPNLELGLLWPPLGIQAINPYQVPLLNTTVLLSSGITVTLSHHAIIKKNLTIINVRLIITLILGFYFRGLQGWEYWEASYNFRDSSFGSTFFLATGFHGLHVIVGTLFLFFSWCRFKIASFSASHHIGLEAAIWYWHFVDVVWLFLYRFLYWWSYLNISISSISNFQLGGSFEYLIVQYYHVQSCCNFFCYVNNILYLKNPFKNKNRKIKSIRMWVRSLTPYT
jgi:cytochrome c oxidase subunit 3